MLKRLLLSISLIGGISASAAAQERQWTLDVGDEDAYLIFGVPESDDVGISFWCPLLQGEVNVFLPESDPTVKPGAKVPFSISAGTTTVDLQGDAMPNEESGVASLEATLPASSPIFAAMLETDRFKVRIGAEEIIFPLIDVDLAGLLGMCRKG